MRKVKIPALMPGEEAYVRQKAIVRDGQTVPGVIRRRLASASRGPSLTRSQIHAIPSLLEWAIHQRAVSTASVGDAVSVTPSQ